MAFAHGCNALLDRSLSLTLLPAAIVLLRDAVGTSPANTRRRAQSSAFLVEAAGARCAAEEFIVFGAVPAACVAPVSFRHNPWLLLWW